MAKRTTKANARRKMRVSALGDILLISLSDDGARWRVDMYSEAGNWCGSHTVPDRAAAIRRRRDLYRLHEKLAKERALKKR